MTIHKEGYTLLAVTTILAGTVSALAIYFLADYPVIMYLLIAISLFFFFIILQFFRKPNRHIENASDELVLAPCDGKVVVIEKVFEPEFLKEEVMQVSIFMSPLNVHINFAPVNGKSIFYKYHPGKFLVAWHPKSSEENERTTTVFERADGRRILVRQIAGALAKRIVNYTEQDKLYRQGDEFGFIKFGSRVDLFLPLDAEIMVNLEQKSTGNRTVIAKLK
jgi:phosphatidylserine decarboxylase